MRRNEGLLRFLQLYLVCTNEFRDLRDCQEDMGCVVMHASLTFHLPIDSNTVDHRPKNEKGIRDGGGSAGVHSLCDDRLIRTL